ncbi:hypothetical protein Asp14428_38890 [Actinoplanes sp. NBRC 14428]|nr:hypothetical protein Asp14428_38890 [Actinoplanes sp. NBRC 14428]
MAVRELRKRETWRLVHGTALRLMTERGFDAVSVDDIVAAAGVSRRTFFNYFADKESVVFDPDPDDPALWGELLGRGPGASRCGCRCGKWSSATPGPAPSG